MTDFHLRYDPYAVFRFSRTPAGLYARQKWLSARQSPGGHWGPGIPFDQAVNALAHLSTPEADAQCRKAFSRLPETQNPDGTWGGKEPEWSTFLVVHALRNKKMIAL